ncbi:MAG TPA: transglutaminase domain-containing protein, partial [Bacteroidota bacterium]|nr:transglutaminase domain-containing protein [Bacteroidota bacterium]
MKRITILIIFTLVTQYLFGQSNLKQIEILINKGEFRKAEELIKKEICFNKKLSDLEKLNLSFEIERMNRIRLDFTKSEKEVIDYIKKYIPGVTKKDILKWEKEKSLECMIIDGKKFYFNNAARNLFRINKECKEIKDKKDKLNSSDQFNLHQLLTEIIDESHKSGKTNVKPIKYRIDYTVTLKDDVVPDGEVVRCWLPFPREVKGRQEDIKILSTYPDSYIISDNNKYMHRSIYFEQKVKSGEKTKFSVSFEYTCYAFYNKIEPEKVLPYNENSEEYKKYTSEREPHIVFT